MIIEKINAGIKEAILKRDSIRLDTLRMLKSKILAVDARSNLIDSEVIKIFKTYKNSLKEALDQAKEVKRQDIAEKLQKELIIIDEFLPKTISLEETKKIVVQAIADSGAKTKKDLGLVMKSIKKLNLEIDAGLARDLVLELLAD